MKIIPESHVRTKFGIYVFIINIQDTIEVSKGNIRGRPDNTMAIRNMTKSSINDLQNTTQKAKDWPTRTH